jgi:hypothetical protein
MMDYLEKQNANPKPFVWTKSAGEILEKVAKAKHAAFYWIYANKRTPWSRLVLTAWLPTSVRGANA